MENYKELIKDLCERLPYGVKVSILGGGAMKLESITHGSSGWFAIIDGAPTDFGIDEIKPYLRPMSSMTVEENRVYLSKCKYGNIQFPTLEAFEYLYSIHIDYRGLIEKSLAIEVTKENNPYK